MIDSLFIVDNSGDIFLQKHWKSIVPKSVCDYFFDSLKKYNKLNLKTVISAPHHILISIYRNELYFVACTTREVPPLFVIEFLHRVVDIIEDYFGDCKESLIKENYVVVYELLDEMLDNGFPLATESNILKELIKPPNLLRTIANSVTGKSKTINVRCLRILKFSKKKGSIHVIHLPTVLSFTHSVSATLPSGQLSNVPWRRAGVKYANNEAYFDCTEEIDAIIDKSGSVISAEIQGYIDCGIKLSGLPDLSLSFVNPRLFDDVSFHPCVRYRRWESERVLSFIPPDGNFRLMSYHIGAQNIVSIPIFIRHHISFKDVVGGKIEIRVGPKQTMGKTLENVFLEVLMPKTVLNVNLTSNQGRYSFDPVSKLMVWEVGRIELGKNPLIRGTINLQTGAPLPDSNPTILVKFTINQLAISGLKVNRLDMYGEKYKPFKGVKYITKAGNFQVRT